MPRGVNMYLSMTLYLDTYFKIFQIDSQMRLRESYIFYNPIATSWSHSKIPTRLISILIGTNKDNTFLDSMSQIPQSLYRYQKTIRSLSSYAQISQFVSLNVRSLHLSYTRLVQHRCVVVVITSAYCMARLRSRRPLRLQAVCAGARFAPSRGEPRSRMRPPKTLHAGRMQKIRTRRVGDALRLYETCARTCSASL